MCGSRGGGEVCQPKKTLAELESLMCVLAGGKDKGSLAGEDTQTCQGSRRTRSVCADESSRKEEREKDVDGGGEPSGKQSGKNMAMFLKT